MIDWRFFVALMLGCLMLATRPVAADSTPTSDFIDRGDGTVSHALTGLMWQRCAVGQTWNGLTCEGEAAGFTFAEAQAISSSLGGHVDWRLPSVWELMSIVDFDESTPAINGDLFPNTPPSLPFWSGSLDSAGLYSWFVFSGNGYAGVGNRSEDRAVRLVRGGETIDPYLQTTAEYIDHGDGTVTHQRTGLIWQRCLVGQQWSGSGCDGSPQFHTFEQALSAGSRVAGEHEWRLPSITELYSIVDQSRSEPAILPEIFPQDPGERIWSSSPNASAPTTAWAVDFGLGSTGSFNGGNGYGVRLVQGAQTSDHQTAPVDAASADTPRPLLNPQLYDLVDYFPLEGGAWREYQGIDSDGDRWLSRNETAIEQTRGMELTQERWLEPNGRGGWVLEDYTLLRYDDELLYVEGQYDTVADPPFDAGYLWFSPPLAIPRMVEPGRRYTATGGVTLPWGQRAELVMEFSFYPHPGRRVAAGTFRDCLEVHQSERFSLDDESDSGIWWWCRGVGEVETYDVDPDSGELTDREELLDWWVPGREAVADPVDGWQLAAALDSGRDSFAAAAIDGEIVVYGGNRSEGNNLASTAIYSPQRDRWQDGRNGPQQADQLSGAACDGAFYVTGGDNNGEFPLFLRYTPDRNRWETLDPPPYPLASEVLACAGDALIAVAFERGELLRWGLDDNTGWARLTTIPDRRDQAAVALANGRLYLFGGYASDGAILDSVLVYDLLAQRWLDGPRQPMPLPVAGNPHNSAVPVVDGQAVLVGGVIGDQSGGVSLHNQLQLYALEADRWQFGPALPLGITGHASVVLEDQLYVIGGVSAAGGEARLDSMLRLALNQLPTAPEPPPLQLTPQASVLKPGESLLLSATGGIGDYRWAASAGVLSAVTTATRNRIVTLNGGEKVRFLPPVEPGLHSVVVRSGGQMVAATVTVADLSQAVVDLQLSGVADPLRVEEERVVGVSGYLADGRLVDLARRAEWRSSDPDVATVTAGGRVVGVAGGGFTLTVEVAGQSRTVEWQVEEAEGVIEVDPYPLLIAVGRELQPAVQRVSADGSVHPFASGECALTLLEAGSDKSGEFELLPDGRLRGVEVGEGAVAMSCGGLELTVPVYVMPAQGLTVEPLHQRRVVGQPPRPLRVSGGVPPYRVIGSEGEWQRGAGGWTRSAWRRSGSREVTVIDGAGEQVVVTIETMPLLSISPARADLMPGGTLQLTATGGSGITSWHAEAGRIEGEGASVSYQSPEVNGVYQVTVGDQEGQLATATINVAAGVWVTPSRLMLSPGERHVLQATGGTPPYRATASAGTVVVEGGGVAYTAPSVAGNYLISITDALGEDAQVRVSVRRPLKVRPLELFLEPGEEALLDLSGVVGAAIATAGRGELVTVNDRRLRYIAPAERGNDTVTIRDDEGQLVQVTVQVSSDRLFISPGQEFLRPGEPLDLRAVGGSPPYTWRVVGSGDLEPIAEATRPASSSGESAQGEEDGEGDGGDDGEADGEADGADEQGEAADSAANPSPQNRVRFTAPQESGQSEIRISDSLGREGSALVTIRRGDLATAPQLLLLQPGGEASISALFGIPDYRWSVERGQLASASGETIEYTAPDTPGVVEDWVELEDASGAVVRMRVVISKQGGRRNIVDLYAGEDGRLDEEELQRAVDDYFAAKGWLTREELYQLLDADTQ